MIYGVAGDIAPLPITIGGASDNILDGPITVREGPDIATVEFLFTIHEATEAAFDSTTSTLELSFRTPRLRLRIVQGSATLWDFNPATGVNTGFNARPEISIEGDEIVDSGRSRQYRVSIEIDLPADRYDQSGRRDSTVTLSFSPSRVTRMTVEGEYRSLTGEDSARAQYNANISAYVTTLQAGFGGTWEKSEEPVVAANDTDTICEFRSQYRRLIHDQSNAGLDDADIVNDQLSITPMIVAPGDTPIGSPKRFTESTVRYDAWIDSDLTTDIETKYAGTIRPYLLSQLRTFLVSSQIAVVQERPGYDPIENKISVEMSVLSPNGSSLIEFERKVEVFKTSGLEWDGVWTGDVLSHYEYEAHADFICTVIETALRLGRNAATLNIPAGVFAVGVVNVGQLSGPIFGIDLSRLFGAAAPTTVISEASLVPGGGTGPAATGELCPPIRGGVWRPVSTREFSVDKRIGEREFIDTSETMTVSIHKGIRLVTLSKGTFTAEGGKLAEPVNPGN